MVEVEHRKQRKLSGVQYIYLTCCVSLLLLCRAITPQGIFRLCQTRDKTSNQLKYSVTHLVLCCFQLAGTFKHTAVPHGYIFMTHFFSLLFKVSICDRPTHGMVSSLLNMVSSLLNIIIFSLLTIELFPVLFFLQLCVICCWKSNSYLLQNLSYQNLGYQNPLVLRKLYQIRE